MPVKKCTNDGKPGYKWGDKGKCYTYTPDNESSRKAAKKKAIKQGAAIGDYSAKNLLERIDYINVDKPMKDKIELSYMASIELEEEEDDIDKPILPLRVNGVSVRSGYIENKSFIIPNKELENIAESLKKGADGGGAYILKDHGYKSGGLFGGIKSVDNLIGRINNSEVKDNFVLYYGKLTADEELAKKVKSGLVRASSVGLKAGSVYCSICGETYGECTHMLGQEYPEEGLHESVAEFLDEMGGKPIASLVGRDMQAVEQSIVLFPAVAEATVGSSFGLMFSEETEDFIESVEKLKRKELEEEEDYDCDEETTENDETFNKENSDYIDSEDSKMSEEIADLTDRIDKLESRLEEAENDNDHLEETISDKDSEIETLNSKINDLNGELTTTKELLKQYQDAEAEKLAQENKAVEDAILALASEKKLEVEYDFENMTLAGKKSVLKTLEASSFVAQGSVADDDKDESKQEMSDEDIKAELKRKIFGDR